MSSREVDANAIETVTNPVAPVKPRSRWKKRLLIGGMALVLLVSGAIIGGGAVVLHLEHRSFVSAIPPRYIGRELYEGVSEHTKLDAAQKEQVKTAIDARIQVMERIRESSITEMWSEFEGLRDDVAKILNPDDAAEWNRHMGWYIEKFSKNR